MKLKFLKLLLCAIALVMVFISCGDDDESNRTIVIRDRAEQQAADRDSIMDYLSTHYYNSSLFESGSNHRIDDIIITELAEGETVPDGSTLLLDAIETRTTVFDDTDYEYYFLSLNEGGGDSPNFTDRVRVRYEGYLEVDGEVFDGVATPEDFPMQGIGFSGGVIRGWQLILPEFSVAESFFNGSDGITNYNNYGLGMMFIPSGLAYFAGSQGGIPSYSNLIFKFELLQYEIDDHDNDGIPSYIEDYNMNLDVNDEDTDEDEIPDYFDVDDDGDGILTIFEDIDGDGDPTNDIGVNGIPNYLDPEETESNQDS